MKWKRKIIIVGILLLLSFVTILNSINSVVGEKKSVNLSYGEFTYFTSDEIIDFNEEIVWSFDCSNSIGVTVLALTDDEYSSFSPLGSFTGFEILSNGNFYEDSGRFTTTSTDTWVIIFIHIDTSNLLTNAIVETEVRFSVVGSDTLDLLWQILRIGGPILGGIVALSLIVWLFTKWDQHYQKKKLENEAEIKGITLAEAQEEKKQREFFNNDTEFILAFFGGFLALGCLTLGIILTVADVGIFGVIIIIIGSLGIAGLITFIIIRIIKKTKIRKALNSGAKIVLPNVKSIDNLEETESTKAEEVKQIFCWNCGSKNSISQKFCGECGKNLSNRDE